MTIKIKMVYKNTVFEIEGQTAEEVETKATDIKAVIDRLGGSSVSLTPIGGNDAIIAPSTAVQTESQGSEFTRESLEHLLRFEKDGPMILFRIEADSLVESQSKAFMVIAYALSKFYGTKEITSERVTTQMKSSGVDTKNISNTTRTLTDKRLIVKPLGKKTFQTTPQGERYAVEVLKEELSKFT
ncbi:MAG: hypothetical protein HY516_03930 [Candidatus Aenigmarchaeota archaeon]|nr:hypothetical protein [Candidatus Aenigmarchaeota archaeon]